MRSGLMVVLLALTTGALAGQAPSTTNNDDSCDISVTPAATLLVPYFEVNLAAPPGQGRTTVFNVINVSYLPQIARVTIWSDWAYPVISFSIFLTGYDVQAVDMRDFLVRGMIPSIVGTPGPRSAPNFSNANHSKNLVSECGARMPFVPRMVIDDVRRILTTGRSSGGAITCPDGDDGTELPLGGNHGSNVAVGYATIDVVSTCSARLPTDPNYFTSDLLYDNVLTGDYILIDPKGDKNGYATGAPMVHIRAIPEGGPAGAKVATNLTQTFYQRFKPAVSDRRQPLPSVYAARYIEGGPESFQTRLSVWRESALGAGESCARYMRSAEAPFLEITRFDERENASIHSATISSTHASATLPPVSRLTSIASVFPSAASTDLGGWFYMNLAERNRNTQAWVDVTLFSEGRYGVQFPAAALGNGCSKAPVVGAQIGPRP